MSAERLRWLAPHVRGPKPETAVGGDPPGHEAPSRNPLRQRLQAVIATPDLINALAADLIPVRRLRPPR
jgi:hypothetical protein